MSIHPRLKLIVPALFGLMAFGISSYIVKQSAVATTSATTIAGERSSDQPVITSRGSFSEEPDEGVGTPIDLSQIEFFYGLDDFDAKLSPDGTVTVSAQATLFNRDSGRRYLWSLFITDEETEETLVRRDYDEQVFTVEPGRFVHPTFTENLPLPPARYRVELVLHKIEADAEPFDLQDDAAERASRILGRSLKITVH